MRSMVVFAKVTQRARQRQQQRKKELLEEWARQKRVGKQKTKVIVQVENAPTAPDANVPARSETPLPRCRKPQAGRTLPAIITFDCHVFRSIC